MLPTPVVVWIGLMTATPNEGVSLTDTLHVSEGRYENSPETFPAVRINVKRDRPLDWLTEFQVDGQPVFWQSGTRGIPVVDKRVLSELRQVPLATLARGETREIGRVRKRVDPRALATALIQAEVVLTYVHIEATLTLERLVDEQTQVLLFYTGEHVYYTNEENRDPLSFVIMVQSDGVVSVRNGP